MTFTISKALRGTCYTAAVASFLWLLNPFIGIARGVMDGGDAIASFVVVILFGVVAGIFYFLSRLHLETRASAGAAVVRAFLWCAGVIAFLISLRMIVFLYLF